MKNNNDFNYQKEFLDYLNKNEKCYKLFDEKESEYSFFENQLIATVSDGMQELIEAMSESREIAPEIRVFCMKEDMVNAFCFVTNHHYYIGIHSATYVKLIQRTQILSDYLVQNKQWIYYQHKDVSEVQSVLWVNAFRMILAHEYMHIILGHCDVVCDEHSFLWEVDTEGKADSENLFADKERQAMEFFADQFAAMDAAWQILYKTEDDVEKIKYELLNYYLSVLLVFSIFHEYGESGRSHPRLGVRLHSMISAVDDEIIKGLNLSDSQNKIEEIDAVIDIFMEIIQQFPKLFSYNIVTDLGVEDIDKDYLELYNTASEVVKITNKKAVFSIKEFDKMDQTILEQLASERTILIDAAQSGKSFDEACKSIEKKAANNTPVKKGMD